MLNQRLETDCHQSDSGLHQAPVSLRSPQGMSTKSQQPLWLLKSICPDLSLSSIQATVFQEAWQGKTYGQMASQTRYDPSYLKDVGHKLWRQLSELLGEPVTKHNLYTVLGQRFHDLQQTAPAVSSSPTSPSVAEPVYDLSRAVTVPVFCGRDAELAQLTQSIIHENSRLVGIFGFGGVGKTALAAKLVDQIGHQFDYVLWRSLRNVPTFDLFARSLLQTLADQVLDRPDSPEELVSLLLHHLNERRCLLIVDDWSAVLCGHTAGTYQSDCESYGLFIRHISDCCHRSCVLITSREYPSGLVFKNHPSLPVRSLHLKGLTGVGGRQVLQAFGISETSQRLDQLVTYYAGNLYALRVATQTITGLLGGSVAAFMARQTLVYGDIRRLLEQQVRRLSKLEMLVMARLANHSELVALADLEQDPVLHEYQFHLLEALETLYHRSFLEQSHQGLTSPPFISAYITDTVHSAECSLKATSSPTTAQVRYLDDYRA